MMDKMDSELPVGYRFNPTAEELVYYYLRKRVHSEQGYGAHQGIISDVKLYDFEPGELYGKYSLPRINELVGYFFNSQENKNSRTPRKTPKGYLKATGNEHKVESGGQTIGWRKVLVYYQGEVRKGKKGKRTNWVMHEYRLHEAREKSKSKSSIVLCHVYVGKRGLKNEEYITDPFKIDENGEAGRADTDRSETSFRTPELPTPVNTEPVTKEDLTYNKAYDIVQNGSVNPIDAVSIGRLTEDFPVVQHDCGQFIGVNEAEYDLENVQIEGSGLGILAENTHPYNGTNLYHADDVLNELIDESYIELDDLKSPVFSGYILSRPPSPFFDDYIQLDDLCGPIDVDLATLVDPFEHKEQTPNASTFDDRNVIPRKELSAELSSDFTQASCYDNGKYIVSDSMLSKANANMLDHTLNEVHRSTVDGNKTRSYLTHNMGGTEYSSNYLLSKCTTNTITIKLEMPSQLICTAVLSHSGDRDREAIDDDTLKTPMNLNDVKQEGHGCSAQSASALGGTFKFSLPNAFEGLVVLMKSTETYLQNVFNEKVLALRKPVIRDAIGHLNPYRNLKRGMATGFLIILCLFLFFGLHTLNRH